MEVEALKEILDGVAFVLVTPEFLGKERLEHFREATRRFRQKLFPPEVDPNRPPGWMLALFALFILTIPLDIHAALSAVATIVVNPDADWTPARWALYYIDTAAMPGFLLLVLAVFVCLYVAQVIAYRGILFWIGTLVFFASRGMAFWYAQHHLR
jgi:hypothetical protein